MMHRGPYQFNSDDAFRFANEMFTPTKRRGNELQFERCPYCKSAGKNDRYKFSINLKTGLYKCLRASCGAHGNMPQLAKDFGFDLGSDMEYYQPRKQYRIYRKLEKKIEPKNAAIEYLKSRGISEQITRDYGITVKADDDNILVFPFFDQTGEEIQLIKYRAIVKPEGGNKEWSDTGCRPILFGMDHARPENGPLVITEGQIDSLSVAEAGIKNAVSVPNGKNGFTWIPQCWDFINQYPTVIVFGDYERGEISLLSDMVQRFGRNVVIKHVRPEDYKDCKDANDILRKYGKEQVVSCIANAEIERIEVLKDLADVKTPENIEKLRTGIRCIDNLLHGGLPFGLYHVISGKRGAGKSTLASQIFAQALEQGYQCMAYSGELPNYRFKFWLDLQLAGNRYVIDDPKTAGREYHDYVIAASAEERITEWYRGKCLIYDNTIVHGGDEQMHLLDVIDEAIRRYGVKVILLDNLMTAMHKDEPLEYRPELERQGAFADKLADIAQETGALILMVAHKRKESLGGTDAADDVSGSAQITNYAGVVISYDRYTEKEIKTSPYLADCRKLTITKNRLYGSINTSGIALDFDEKCKRIYGNGDDLNYRFGWEKLDWDDLEDAEIPF